MFAISAERSPKMLNPATFWMKISWPKMMFQCFPSVQIYDIRPPILIYAPKTRIWTNSYWQFMELSWQKNRENENLIRIITLPPITSPRKSIGWCSLHSHVLRLHDTHVHMRSLQFGQWQMYCWYLCLAVKTPFYYYIQ